MALVSPSVTIVFVFLVTSWTLCVSVSRDLAAAPQLAEWRTRLQDLALHPFNGTAIEQEVLHKDLHLALSAILRSELTVYLLVQWCLSAYAVVALLTVAVFLGQLSSRETSRLSERLVKYIVFKVVFCGALIIPDIYEIVLWLAWFAMVGYMRIFMGAAKDRLESLVVSPRATTWSHLRTLALVLVILVHDLVGAAALLSLVGSMPLTKVLLCSFDMAVVLVEGIKTLLRYAVHLWDQRVAAHGIPDAPHSAASSSGLGWEAWEGKGALLYHTELVADVLIHAMTLAHYLHVWFLHGLSFQLIDAILFLDIRAIILSMFKRIRGYLNYRHATHSLRHAFPDAVLGSAQELCSICMERMSCAKQLPCQHHFHLACLRAWLQQSGTESFACPLCRTPLLRERAAAAAAAQHLRRQQHQHQRQQPRGPLRRLWAGVSRMVSALYLDLIFGLILGLPSSTAALQRHAMAAAAARREREAGNAGGTASRSGRRSGRRGDEPPVEHVDENDIPPPAAASRGRSAAASGAAAGAPSGLRGWLGALVPRRWTTGATSAAAGAGGSTTASESTDDGDEEDDTSVTDSEEYFTDEEDMHDIAAEDDSFQGPSQLARRSALDAAAPGVWGLPPRRRQAYSLRGAQQGGGRSHGIDGVSAQEYNSGGAGGSDASDGEGERLPPALPPPYPEPSTWSAGSLQAVGRQVARTIRSSWGMGVHGPGAVAGHEHGITDQEAESGLRVRSRQRIRPDATTRVASLAHRAWQGQGQHAGADRETAQGHAGRESRGAAGQGPADRHKDRTYPGRSGSGAS